MPTPATPIPTLLSIGYEKAGFGDFLLTLQAARVATVIDVRDLPLSRRAGFSQTAASGRPRRGRNRLSAPASPRHSGRRPRGKPTSPMALVLGYRRAGPREARSPEGPGRGRNDSCGLAKLPPLLRGRPLHLPPPPRRRAAAGEPWLHDPPPAGRPSLRALRDQSPASSAARLAMAQKSSPPSPRASAARNRSRRMEAKGNGTAKASPASRIKRLSLAPRPRMPPGGS